MTDPASVTREEKLAKIKDRLHHASYSGIFADGDDDVEYLFALLDSTEQKLAALKDLLNTPETLDFIKAVPLEAAHQRERWGSEHDAGKTAADWFWLVGYLAGKALHMHAAGNTEKALHHTISTAAALANWHAAILGKTDMRPGSIPPEDSADPGALRAKPEDCGCGLGEKCPMLPHERPAL